MQMRTNVALLTKVDGVSPPRNPSMDTENARVASLIALEEIFKQAEVRLCSTLVLCLASDYQGLYYIIKVTNVTQVFFLRQLTLSRLLVVLLFRNYAKMLLRKEPLQTKS